MYFLGGSLTRQIGVSSLLTNQTGIVTVSEFSFPPFGYILQFNPKKDLLGSNIIDWANKYTFNDCVNINLEMRILENNIPLPLDFRSKDKIKEDYVNNKIAQAIAENKKNTLLPHSN